MGLKCTGDFLPEDVKIVSYCEESATCLDDFCLVGEPEDQILLFEILKKSDSSQLYYWAIIEVDDFPLGVCELEKYADHSLSQWLGRRSDYLIIGSYRGDCFCLVVEMRHVLVKESQKDDKFEQLKETLTQIIQQENIILESQILAQVYPQPENIKYLGVLIAPGNTRSFNRWEINKVIEINERKIVLRTLPSDALKDCQIQWTTLLQKLGVR
jgi:hypothetical protein